MKKKYSLRSLVSFVAGCSLALQPWLRAQGQSDDYHGAPLEIEARPPLHFRPFIAGSPSGYTPAQVRHAYGFDQIAGNGAGQTIAIVDAYGSATLQNDLNAFSAAFGLPSATVHVYYP